MDIPITCMAEGISSDVMLSAIGFNKGNQLRIGTDRNRNIANVNFLTRMPPYDGLIGMMTRLPEFQSFSVVRGCLNRESACFMADFLHRVQNRFQSADMRGVKF